MSGDGLRERMTPRVWIELVTRERRIMAENKMSHTRLEPLPDPWWRKAQVRLLQSAIFFSRRFLHRLICRGRSLSRQAGLCIGVMPPNTQGRPQLPASAPGSRQTLATAPVPGSHLACLMHPTLHPAEHTDHRWCSAHTEQLPSKYVEESMANMIKMTVNKAICATFYPFAFEAPGRRQRDS